MILGKYLFNLRYIYVDFLRDLMCKKEILVAFIVILKEVDGKFSMDSPKYF